MKPILSFVLAVAQLAACGASPTYLCIARDGSVSLALSPDDCNCPHHAGSQAVDGGTIALPLPSEGQTSRVGWHQVDSCGCLHLELVHEQAPTVERASASEQMLQMISLSAATPGLASLACAAVILDSPDSLATSAPPLRADFGALLSTVVLRL